MHDRRKSYTVDYSVLGVLYSLVDLNTRLYSSIVNRAALFIDLQQHGETHCDRTSSVVFDL